MRIYRSRPVQRIVQWMGTLGMVLIIKMILESLHLTGLEQLFFLLLLLLGMVAISERVVQLAKWLVARRPQPVS